MDFSYLETISDGDKDFIKEFIDTFESNSAKIMEGLNNAMKKNDQDALKKLAHQLKPSLEMLALPSLAFAQTIQNQPETATQEHIDQMGSECLEAISAMRKEFSV